MLYDPHETEISEKYLERIFSRITGDVCLLGGWATHQLVGGNFKRALGTGYIGSTDIDIGFHVERDWTDEQLRTSELSTALSVLGDMGFWPVSFRFAKDFEAETRRELTPEEAAKLPRHEIFQLYVDPIVDVLHPNIRSVLGFVPIDEPLLSLVFSERPGAKVRMFGIEVPLPEAHVLLAMKLNSVPNRDREYKRIKDIADIYALLWFSDADISELRKRLFSIYPQEKARHTVGSFSDAEIRSVSRAIGANEEGIRRVLAELSQVR